MSVYTNPDIRQFLRYAIVGAIQNGASFAVFVLAVSVNVPYLLAAVIAAVVALTLGFSLNLRWTFPGSEGERAERAIRFVVIWLIFVGIALPTLALLVEVAHLPRVLAQALILVFAAPFSFLLQRRWTFGPGGAR